MFTAIALHRPDDPEPIHYPSSRCLDTDAQGECSSLRSSAANDRPCPDSQPSTSGRASVDGAAFRSALHTWSHPDSALPPSFLQTVQNWLQRPSSQGKLQLRMKVRTFYSSLSGVALVCFLHMPSLSGVALVFVSLLAFSFESCIKKFLFLHLLIVAAHLTLLKVVRILVLEQCPQELQVKN
jgi:hypothetical protein